ncbi:energy transducer TonB [Erythrobacter rubeus]|uniref:TonB family protein n=1 Tax=Erythrobacter rubeus TaxID=2760803 RepID=A0ABR8KRF8_9SPHN|nr:energy transducer TonB [Erythrobacter rubeus]MBD2840706.1 TonB family protein [Erythrobacter rubeus]
MSIILVSSGAILLSVSLGQSESSRPEPISPEQWMQPSDFVCPFSGCRDEGEVEFEAIIAADGRVVSCRILQSSGSDLFDKQTCRVLIGRARFEPARDARGNKVEGSFRSTVKWNVPEVASEPDKPKS